MIEDFVQTLVNLMIDAGTDETIKHLKDSCEKQQVEKKIIKYAVRLNFIIHIMFLALFEMRNYNVLCGGAKWTI